MSPPNTNIASLRPRPGWKPWGPASQAGRVRKRRRHERGTKETDGLWWLMMVSDGLWWLMMVDDDDGTYGSRILVARQSFRKLLTSQEKSSIGQESDSLYINFSVILLISLWVFPAPSLIGTCIFAGQWVNDSHIHWLHPNLITMNYPVVRRAKKHEGAMGIRIPCEMGSQGVTKSFRITW